MLLFVTCLVFLSVPLLYFYGLLLASALPSSEAPPSNHAVASTTRFAVVIAAHNEAPVIKETAQSLLALNYPILLRDLYVVADGCDDQTALLAREAGAIVYERAREIGSCKGAALSYLFSHMLDESKYDAIVIFDADTRVDPQFLTVIDAELRAGHLVVQGRHSISNAESGWFPALTEAKMLIDNQVNNQGRSRLNLSARNMGDSICFKMSVLKTIHFGGGLTEDFELRQRLLLEGIRIQYAPAALAYGEAPVTWQQAKIQRLRWMKGANEVSRNFRRRLLTEGLRRRDARLLDAAIECFLPTYSTLALFASALILMALLGGWHIPVPLFTAIVVYFTLVIGYPCSALIVAKAPMRSYISLFSGIYFIVWRGYEAIRMSLGAEHVRWVRTPHGVGH